MEIKVKNMKFNYKKSNLGTKQTKVFKLFNDKVLLGSFALIFLVLATFCSTFLNTAQATVVLADDPVTGCPATHTALGGVITSNPTASVINSRVVVFARGTDNAIYYQISTGFPFSGWISLGGGTTAAPMSIVIGATLYVEVVGTDGNRYNRSTIDGFIYTDWIRGTVGATTTANAVLGTVTYNFLRGATGTQPNLCVLLTGSATPTPTVTPTPSPTGTFNAVTGCPAGYVALGSNAAAAVASVPTTNTIAGRVVVFVRGSDNAIYFKYSTSSTAFSDWNFLAGATTSPPMSIVIGSNIFVEMIGTDGNRYYKSSPDGLGFGAWTQGTVGATINSSTALGNVGYNFVSGLSGSSPNLCVLITVASTPTPTPTLTPTPTPTGTPNATTGCPAGYSALGGVVSSNPTVGVVNNRVVVFARGSDGAIYYQFSSDFPFSGWRSLAGGSTAAAPKSRLIGSILYVEVVGTDSKIYTRSTSDGVTFTDWTEGTVGATTSSTAVLGSVRYDFTSGLTGSSPNLCVLLTNGATPTPTPAPTATPTPTVTATPTPTATPGINAITGCSPNFTALGGVVKSNPTTAVINNRVIAFAVGTDNGIYYQSSSGTVFSGWISLGGGTTATPRTIVVGSTLYVEVVGTDGNNYYRSTTDGVNYTNFAIGTFGATTTSSAVLGSVGYNFQSGLTGSSPNLCVLITNNATPTPTPTATATPNSSTGCTAEFISLGGFITTNPTTSVFNNRIYVFAAGTDGKIYYQFSSGNTFSGWNSLDGGTRAAPKSIVVGTTLSVEVIGTDNNNYFRSTTNGSTFTDWTAGTVNATTNSTAVFGGKTYTFVMGTNSSPHLCVKIQ